jgi:hypothetical protein
MAIREADHVFASLKYRREDGSWHDQGTRADASVTNTVLPGCFIVLSLTPPNPGRVTATDPTIRVILSPPLKAYVEAGRSLCPAFGGAENREQQRGENNDNGNHDQQFDQGESFCGFEIVFHQCTRLIV